MGEARQNVCVVPATWEVEVGRSLEPGVQGQPGQHSETLFPTMWEDVYRFYAQAPLFDIRD
jgi:hypothetical protein